VAEGDFTIRVPEQGSGEFSPLSKTFNSMADERRLNLTADVVHELRAPIHILQGNLEGIQDRSYNASPEPIEAMLEEPRL
jgi:signal transduction histidine kinase